MILAFSKGQDPILDPVCAESREVYSVAGRLESQFIWMVEGGTILRGEGNDTIEIQWHYELGHRRIEVLEVTKEGCTDVPSVAFVDVVAPEPNLGNDFVSLCSGEFVVLDASGDYLEPSNYLWQDGTSNSIYIADTTELVWVRVEDAMGCIRYDSAEVTDFPLPVVNLGGDTVLCDDENPLILYAGDFAEYEWRINQVVVSVNAALEIMPNDFGVDTVVLSVTSFDGCVSGDTLLIFPCDIVSMFKNIPNTITPNGDGANDLWNIPYTDLFPEAILEVFDQWGRLVYRTDKVYHNPWDGKSKGRDLPMDSYHYVLYLNYLNVEPIKGTVNIIK